jgi:phosphatidylserine/phosphatidylglycerophosphate/cardiolipin synthase-like enzyme
MDFVRPVRPVELALVAGRGHYETVIARVMEAQTSVWIATANLKELLVEDSRARPGRRRRLGRTAYRSVLAVFEELALRGVELRILHAAPPSRPFRAELAQHPGLASGLALRLCPRVHFKAVIVDGTHLYLGSANWTGAGLGVKGAHRRNFELGMVTSDLGLLDEVQAYYEALWRGRECAACKLREECPRPLDTWLAPVAPGAAPRPRAGATVDAASSPPARPVRRTPRRQAARAVTAGRKRQRTTGPRGRRGGR